MKETVYVFGHQNPDSDSICAAISYAHLKNQLDPQRHHMPIALKEVNKETAYILKHFGVEPPPVVEHLKLQVTDINLTPAKVVKEMDSIRKVLEAITGETGRSIPVVDQDERLIGLVSISDIMPTYLGQCSSNFLKDSKTPFVNLIQELDLKLVSGTIKEEYVSGRVYLSSDVYPDKVLEKEDLVLCDAQELAHLFETKDTILQAGYFIVGNVRDPEDLLTWQDHRHVLLSSELKVYELVKKISQTIPVSTMVKKDGLEYFVTYETLEDVQENIVTSKHHHFPVVDEWGYIQGMLSKSNLVDVNRKKAILVDHNERGQSIQGIDDLHILEIIDHHRVADVMTMAPLYFRVEPVGCTCTLVARMYEEQGVEIPRQIAGLLLSAIISDTLLFKSPTCTPLDKATAEKLAPIAGVDTRYYGMHMITEGSSLEEKSPEELLHYDMKQFMFGPYRVRVSQINTGDFDGFYKVYPGVLAYMEDFCRQDGLNLWVFMVTDVVVGGTELIVAGDSAWIAENAFRMKPKEKSIFLYDVFSRKKQVVPQLMNAAKL
ncbi:putative manganese-dependent inorganic diphosphatase [Anaerotalea alkaliphila]|uniref:inorganic diphosphatase n=1 Tax=Anaerotalea alkaliphila TaxID=2662126 RepID=A0A7X5HVJ8_9FIRM|nr:putative manganese-dependent inorganic diphosphatase [Anaerotalea alkaliphila]NDL67226.1 putative manganese-dependent inorganic diphosphatase [Anaerotalea alkaliphila]